MPDHPINTNQITIVPILLSHLKRYPLMAIQDIYKLIHQAAMGPEHLIKNKDTAFEKLCGELEQIDAHSSRPLWEKIDPSDRLVRLNLASFKEKQGDPKKLFEAFYQTASTFNSSPDKIERYWNEVLIFAEQNHIPYLATELRAYFKTKVSQNHSAEHHSDTYAKVYQPAYRLISKKYLGFL